MNSATTLARPNQPARRSKRVHYAAGLILLSVAALLVACTGGGSDRSAHDDGDHEEGTDLLVVKSREQGSPLDEDPAEEILSYDDVVRVEKYIRLRMESFDVVGIEPSAPMRIMTGQPDVHLTGAELTAGRELEAKDADENLVLAGQLFAQSVGTSTGRTFGLPGTEYELVVAGEFSTTPPELSSTILMPLSLVQEIYGKDRKVTHFWVSVESPDSVHDVIRALQLGLGESVEVLPRTHQ